LPNGDSTIGEDPSAQARGLLRELGRPGLSLDQQGIELDA